ncbi:MAG: transporter substrate-binding domain-containing protein [Spirochaetaceae bacterium]
MHSHRFRGPCIVAATVLWVLSAATVPASGEAERSHWNEVQERGTLIVATSGTLFPASFYGEDNESLTGYDVEVIREVSEELGVDVDFRIMAFDAMLASLKTRQVDVAVNDINRTAEREEQVRFSTPYKYSYATLMVREDDLSEIHSLDDLEGKVHAGEATTTFSRIMRSYGAEILTYDNATNDQYLRDLEIGRSDVIMNDYYLQRPALQFMPEFDVELHPELRFWIEPAGSHVAMPKESTELEAAVNNALQALRQDGTLAEISRTFYGGDDVTTAPDIEEEGFIRVSIDELPE